jgi:hypothetical protein
VISLVFLIERALLFLHNASAAVVQGVALGLLNNPQLERLTEARYQQDALSSDSYAEPQYLDSGLSLWERNAIQHYFPPGCSVLVASAGAGREMIALARAGFRVDGFDCCKPLVDAGRQALNARGVDAKLEHAPPSKVPPVLANYEAVLVGFSGYMYIPGRQRRIDFLRDLRRVLSPGAPLMVSFTEGFHGRRRTWQAKVGTALRSLRGAEPVEEGDAFKKGFQHHFVREQILTEMSEAGFEVAHYGGGTCYGNAVGLKRVE